MKKLFLVAALSTVGFAAHAQPISLSDKICDQAVSLAACVAHVRYAEKLGNPHPIPDTSPEYMIRLDPRYNLSMQTAGGGSSGGGTE